MLRLPVSGLRVNLLAPTGREDVMLLEAAELDLSLALAILERLARPLKGMLDLDELIVTDYQALLLGVHSVAFDSCVKSELRCGKKGCDSIAEISFEVDGYVAHKRPRIPRGVSSLAEQSGWFELQNSGATLRYRLPTVADIAAATREQQPERELIKRCVDGPVPDGPIRRKLEKAMEAQAPSLSGQLKGECPGCGEALFFFFDVQSYVLRELRDQAAFVYQDAHLLALNYHWPEEQILEMPRHRRMQYAEMLRGQE
jgi:hypothetical protein